MNRPIDYARFEDGTGLNYWSVEPALRQTFSRGYAKGRFVRAETALDEFGETVGQQIAPNADIVDAHGPTLSTYDRDGELANEVTIHPAQAENERLAIASGLIADALRGPPGEAPLGPMHALAMQTLACYADVGLVCAVSMTAGVALVLDHHDDAGHYDALYRELTAREPERASQGAMFLTERHAGSDVGAIETTAERISDPDMRRHGDLPMDRVYALDGEKWFCSNIEAQGTLALARRPGGPDGTRGLSLFWVPHLLADGELNRQVYRRLKDKLGTESVPTGEVVFDGTFGYLVGEAEGGFRSMTTMLNWERVTNATGAVGVMGRALLESKIHAANREAFGKRLDAHPLMRRDLLDMQADFEAALAVAVEAGKWFDRHHRDPDNKRSLALMRGLVPVAKYRTGRLAVDAATTAVEIRGGDGYVSDFVQERLLRDAQVLPIWEGTSNVLSLDLLRALDRVNAGKVMLSLVNDTLAEVSHPLLEDSLTETQAERDALEGAFESVATADDADAQHRAKALADMTFDVIAAARLLAMAQDRLDSEEDARKAALAAWFVSERLGDDRPAVAGTAVDDEVVDAILRYAPLDPADRKAV